MPAPVLTISQMREWEQATWAANRSEDDVIRRVGHIVADRAVRMTRPADLVIVLAGKGHNGDDARRASQNLFDREAQNKNSPEGEIRSTGNPLNAPKGSAAQITIAECRAANVLLDKEIDAIYAKASKERKITPAEVGSGAPASSRRMIMR